MAKYTEKDIKSLDWNEHIRMRPGMYIGKLGNGKSPDDGIYILLKEALDNAIDEFTMGHGKRIEINHDGKTMEIRDYGRGIPLGKVYDCAAKINTGAKYDSEAFKKTVGLNGVGVKAVNALSSTFEIQAYREKKTNFLKFEAGKLAPGFKADVNKIEKSDGEDGTRVLFIPDETLFTGYHFQENIIEEMIKNYSYLNTGLSLILNGKKFSSSNGLLDLLTAKLPSEPLYPIVHLVGKDIEVAFTHLDQLPEDYYSFVNGQYTTQGGTHLAAFRGSIVDVIRDFYKKPYEASDVRSSLVAAVSVRIEEPVFESQTKTKLGSQNISPKGETIKTFIANFLKKELDDYLHKHANVAQSIKEKIVQSERERKELTGIQKLARDRAKKAKIHNKKLRDCRIHYDTKNPRRDESTLFITEGDSASGSITKSRDVDTQAVFSLRGKPLNCFGMSRRICYENEEFNLLQACLNIEDDLESLRYNKVVVATDADNDGMHIRLLLLTFFLQYFPELIKEEHVFILDTPLFRVRNKKETIYCYSEEEKSSASAKLGANPEITRFKGLGEISPDEFAMFIGKDIRLEPVKIDSSVSVLEILNFYMGKNTPARKEYIVNNLKVEEDLISV
jgi:topoisomerase IV subunit B